ncbi:LysR family transcriptional regulator [Leminorella grimontii]|uniref:LysR family transcriptional regulator n=1 Tax=Leminorella grimontii TaxID=82981 RepID=UPI0020876FE6|nr:LysR family transcriptional regulator [Leminorella grimontii]GKX61039.1 LysR family transcriptional regulator [Leminorella grimontii]
MQDMHRFELTWLEDCVALADTLNFSKAAALRYVTQPAFSRRIQSLEEWVGTPLFARNRRGVQLTDAGQLFCKQAPDLLRTLFALRDEARDAAGKGQSSVVFCATHALSFSFFPQLMRRNEHIARFGAFRLLSDTMRACERMLMQGEAQFLLCHRHAHMHSELDPERFTSVRMGQDVLIPYSAARPGSIEPVWPLDGKIRFPYLSFSNASGLGRIIANSPAVSRLRKSMDVAFTSDLAATLLAMVRAGDGVAWLPQTLAEPDAESGKIVAAAGQESGLWIPVEIHLYRPVNRMSLAVEGLWGSFVDEND